MASEDVQNSNPWNIYIYIYIYIYITLLGTETFLDAIKLRTLTISLRKLSYMIRVDLS